MARLCSRFGEIVSPTRRARRGQVVRPKLDKLHLMHRRVFCKRESRPSNKTQMCGNRLCRRAERARNHKQEKPRYVSRIVLTLMDRIDPCDFFGLLGRLFKQTSFYNACTNRFVSLVWDRVSVSFAKIQEIADSTLASDPSAPSGDRSGKRSRRRVARRL